MLWTVVWNKNAFTRKRCKENSGKPKYKPTNQVHTTLNLFWIPQLLTVDTKDVILYYQLKMPHRKFIAIITVLVIYLIRNLTHLPDSVTVTDHSDKVLPNLAVNFFYFSIREYFNGKYTPLVKFIRNYIRFSSGVFSASPLAKILMTSFSAFLQLIL